MANGIVARALRQARRLLGHPDPVLLAALALGLFLRGWQFGTLPPGLNQDEASTAYDAFSLVHYGVDRHGFRFPVVLVSWGSGMYALASYVEAPFIWLFGLRVWSARLPFLLAGVIALPLFYCLLRRTVDRPAARLGVVVLALNPWHVMASRWGLDCNLFPFVFLLATVLLVRSMARRRGLWVATALFGVSLYAYGTAYLVVPVFLLLVLGHGLWHRTWPMKTVLAAAAVFALVSGPVLVFLAVNSFGWSSIETPLFSIPRLTGRPRFQTMGNWDLGSPAFARRTLDNWREATGLFLRQDDGLIWNVLPGHGLAFWFSSFLAVAGLALLVGRCLRRGSAPSFPVLAWCLAAALLVGFVTVNANRANIAMFPFIYCATLAMALLWRYRALAVLLGLLLLTSSASFARDYFGSYRQMAADAFFASFGEAVRYAAGRTDGEICITDSVSMPYIFVLFYTQADPREFERTVRYQNPGAEFEAVAAFGRYRFGLASCPSSATVIVASPAEAEKLETRGFVTTEFERYRVLVRDGEHAASGVNEPPVTATEP